MTVGKNNLRTVVVCCVLALGTALLYAPAVTFDFLNYDDLDYIVNNFHINRGFHWSTLAWCFQAGYASNWHPLTWMSHLLDCQLYGLRPAGHHATSVVLHSLNSMLLFLTLRRMTGAFWRSAFVAAAFAWHPLHVESVAWVSERKDVLSTFFLILTLWAYVRYCEGRERNGTLQHGNGREKAQKAQNKKAEGQDQQDLQDGEPASILSKFSRLLRFFAAKEFFYFLTLVFFALGLMSKPMLVTLPFLLLLLDWWPLRRPAMSHAKPPGKKAAFRRKDLTFLYEKIPFFVLSIISCLLTLYAQHHGGAMQSLANDPIQSRVSNSLVAYCQYLGKFFWPANLTIIYPLDKNLPGWEPVAAALLLLAISAAALYFWRTRPYFTAGWLWFLGTLVPVIGLVQVGGTAIADRYTYIPSIGIFIAVCWGVYDFAAARNLQPAVLATAAGAALASCILLTGRQLQYWRNGETLFRHAVAVTPGDCIAHATLGNLYFIRRQFDKARAECEEAIRLDPSYPTSYIFLGQLLFLQGKTQESASALREAVHLAPWNSDARSTLAQALLALHLPGQAAEQAGKILKSDPNNPDAHFWLGKALALQGNLDEAKFHFEQALRQIFEYPEAHLELAMVLSEQHQTTEAISHYRSALKFSPNDARALNNLAWILASDPHAEIRNGAEAVRLAERACVLTKHEEPFFLGTLADAYAEAGNFEEAVSTAQKAHDLAAADGLDKVAARNLELLEIYRSHHAFHEK